MKDSIDSQTNASKESSLQKINEYEVAQERVLQTFLRKHKISCDPENFDKMSSHADDKIDKLMEKLKAENNALQTIRVRRPSLYDEK